MQQKRDEAHREKAAEIRREAENMELDAREREAKAARARADAEQAQVNAARLKQEADATAREAQSLRADVADHTRKADEVDPDVGRDGVTRGMGSPGDGAGEARPERQEGAHADRGRMDAARDEAARRDGENPRTGI